MLLTRRACYGLVAGQHLAEHAGEGPFSANDLAEFYGLPHEALAKILQRLATAGVLLSHHGIKGGYTLARDPRYISVFDVINHVMRKRLITPIPQAAPPRDEGWLDIERTAVVEVTSEEKGYPVESPLVSGETQGWRAADSGSQTIRPMEVLQAAPSSALGPLSTL